MAFDDLYARKARNLLWKLREADVDIEAGRAAGKTGQQMLAEANLRVDLGVLGMTLSEGSAGRFEVHRSGARMTWGTVKEIREWIAGSEEYEASR